MQSDTLVGIFSERDVMSRVVLVGLDPKRTCVGEVMTRDVVCVETDVSPDEAMAIITNRRLRHLPVVEGRRVVGVVSIGDLVRWAIRDREQSIEQLRDYVTGRYPG
jgi:CBS domain-containing protein